MLPVQALTTHINEFDQQVSATQESQRALAASLDALQSGLRELQDVLPPAEWSQAAARLPKLQARAQKAAEMHRSTQERIFRIEAALLQRQAHHRKSAQK